MQQQNRINRYVILPVTRWHGEVIIDGSEEIFAVPSIRDIPQDMTADYVIFDSTTGMLRDRPEHTKHDTHVRYYRRIASVINHRLDVTYEHAIKQALDDAEQRSSPAIDND